MDSSQVPSLSQARQRALGALLRHGVHGLRVQRAGLALLDVLLHALDLRQKFMPRGVTAGTKKEVP